MHRLLKTKSERYFSKGDNSFRLEGIVYEQIIGAVILNNDKNNSAEFVTESLNINRIFRKNGYYIELTKATPEYLKYKDKYLESENEVYEK